MASALLREWSEGGDLPCPVVMMSGHATVETAVEATRLGAYDFIEKPISLAKLLLTVERAFESDRLQRENVDLREHTQLVVEPVGQDSQPWSSCVSRRVKLRCTTAGF